MKWISTVFLFLVSLMIQAQTTYYIDPVGNNGNSGAIGSPWLTLSYACTRAKTPGDIIHVNTGIYFETVQSVLAVGVSIQGDGKANSIINSTVSATNIPAILLLSETYVNGNQSISGIKLDGNMTANTPIWVKRRSNVKIHDCEIVNFLRRGIRLLGSGAPPSIWCTGNEIYNCTIANNAAFITGAGQYGNIEMHAQNGLKIYNNTITQTTRAPEDNGIPIKFTDEGYNKNLKIYSNTITGPKKGPSGRYEFAIELWYPRGGDEIYDNIITGSIDLVSPARGTANYSVSIHNNTIGYNTLQPQLERGILLEKYAEYVLIYNNIIKNISTGFYVTEAGTAPHYYNNIRIYCNVFMNMGQTGTEFQTWGMFFPDSGNSTGHGWYIHNNVIVASNEGRTTRWGIQVPRFATFHGLSIKNNILMNWDHAPINGDLNATLDTLNISNNIFFNNANSNNVLFANGLSPINYTNENNLKVDPGFVSLTDFHLQAGSPAIGAGINVGLSTDKDGVDWNNPPSIGAYEYPRISGNKLPSIKDQGFQLNKNSSDGTVVGTVVASDPDKGQTLSYSIVSGNTNGAFAINAMTGVLTVANSAALNVDFALVVKVQDNGVGELSSQAILAIDVIPTGIELTGINGAIKVYPNPVSSELFIEYKGNKERLIFNILNSVGQIVFNGNLAEKTVVQTNSFSPGVYLMKIEDGRSFEFRKIIKV